MKKNINTKNEKEKIDILFEDSLKEYKVAPSKQVWEGVERNFPDKLFGGLSSFKTRLFYMSIIISLVLTSAIVYFVYENNSQSKETSLEFIENNEESKKTEITEETKININNDEEIISLENPVSIEAQNQIINNIEIKSTNTIIEEKISLNNSVSIEDQNITKENIEKNPEDSNEEIITYDRNLLNNPDKYSLTHSNLIRNNYERTNRDSKLTRLIPLKYELIDFNSSNNRIFSDYRNENSMVALPVEKKNDRRKRMDISFGINITTSVIYYKSSPKQNAMAFDFVAEHEINKFSIQMGIGASYSNDNGEYTINYQSFDSVGYYLSVVSFTFDPVKPDSIIFNTKSVDIFDTVKHYEISRLQNNYSYLQFPLLAYYKLFNFKGISCSMKAGTIFSILIGKNEPEVNYSNKEAFLIDINRQTQARLKTNWRIVAGIRFKYQISGKVDLVCEPTYMQFINSIYEKDNNTISKKPHIIGLRAGLLFKL
jgi:hypothetical protein